MSSRLRDFRQTLVNAERHLQGVDPVMATLIDRHGPCRLKPKTRQMYFPSLVSSIIGQQLSEKASATIERRMYDMFKFERPLDPGAVCSIPVWRLRKAGLSQSKASFIINLARATVAGDFDLRGVHNLGDEVVIEKLTQLPGIGTWTAEMFLIFGLGRTDIWSTNDAALRRAVRLNYGVDAVQADACIQRLTEAWRPYRSVASWFLWRSLD